MKQKTFVTEYKVKVGDEVILISEACERGSGKEHFDLRRHKGEGIPGNMNENTKRYHGWRGTSYGISLTAYGVRKVTKVVDLGEVEDFSSPDWGRHFYKVTVGQDLHPEWD